VIGPQREPHSTGRGDRGSLARRLAARRSVLSRHAPAAGAASVRLGFRDRSQAHSPKGRRVTTAHSPSDSSCAFRCEPPACASARGQRLGSSSTYLLRCALPGTRSSSKLLSRRRRGKPVCSTSDQPIQSVERSLFAGFHTPAGRVSQAAAAGGGRSPRDRSSPIDESPRRSSSRSSIAGAVAVVSGRSQ
jgi:hypothetical protein